MSQDRYKPHRDDKINEPPPPTQYELFINRIKLSFLEYWNHEDRCFVFHDSFVEQTLHDNRQKFTAIFNSEECYTGNGKEKAVRLLALLLCEMSEAASRDVLDFLSSKKGNP